MNRLMSILALVVVFASVSPGVADVIVSRNLGPGAYSASAVLDVGFEASRAFDGSLDSGWNSGDFPLQWVEVDLQHQHGVTSVRLDVDQNPDGNTVHELWVSSSAMQADVSGGTLLHTFAGFTAYQQTLTFTLPSPLLAQFVQVRTTSSPSWVAWLEVEVRAVPEPWTVILVGIGMVGLPLARRHRREGR